MSAPRRNAPPMTELLAAVVECSDDAIITNDLSYVLTWNKAAERIFGYTAAQMLGRPISILASPDRVDEISSILQRIRQGERIDHYQTICQAKGGRLVNISLTVSPIKDTRGRLIGASKTARDITEQVRAAERLAELNTALRKSEAEARQARDWFETTLKGIGDAVVTTDASGRISFLNAVAESLTGWKLAEATGRPLEEVFVITNEEKGAVVDNPVSKVLQEGRIMGLANHTRLAAKDGGNINAEILILTTAPPPSATLPARSFVWC